MTLIMSIINYIGEAVRHVGVTLCRTSRDVL